VTPAPQPAERVLAVDHGERRIGLALWKPGAGLVHGLPTLDRRALKSDPAEAVAAVARDHQVDVVVLGIPYSLSGEEGPAAAEVRSFQRQLADRTGLPIEPWDERLTTEAARRRLHELGYDEKEIRARVDQLSAVLMLEAWLRQREAREALAEPPPSTRGTALVAALAALLLGLAALGWFWWASGPPSRDAAPVQVAVARGTSVRSLARELEDRGIVRSSVLLEAWLRARGEATSIQAGTYAFRRDRNVFAIADQLMAGETVLAAVTIPEGLRAEQTAGLVARTLTRIDSAAFATLAADSVLSDTLLPDSLVGADAVTLEGYLFPETYRVDPSIDASGMARVMVDEFWRAFDADWRARAESLGVTVHELVTLASIVEEEARVPEEQATIAGVFWNRLRRDMPLEADPTVQYALGGHRSRVLYRDLEVDSPYNTYRNPGLPPGPIASPGRAALEATLYPDSVPYLYFFATGEGGRHTFSETYDEHVRKRSELQR
jgi:UPF0755 protein